jgi:hypothetical protein
MRFGVASLRMLACLVLAGSGAPLAARSDATHGQIVGTVRDGAGGALAGVEVVARDGETGAERRAATDGEGRYRLELLPVGRYALTAAISGFHRGQVVGIELHVGETLAVPFILSLEVSSTLTVSAAPPSIDLTRSHPATVLGQGAIAALPIEGRRFHDFALLAPGVVQVNESFAAGGLAISGQRGIDTAWNVDGVSYDNPFFGGIRGGERSQLAYSLSQEAIEEFAVSTSGYSAEFGRSGGGLVNVVTKRGGNQLAGSLFWYFRDQRVIADDPFGRPPGDYSQHQIGGSLGGPLRRDRTHVFAVYDQQRQRIPFFVEFLRDPAGIPAFAGEEGRRIQTNDVESGFLRLDHRLSDRHQLTVRLSASRNRGENGISVNPTIFADDQSSLERDEITTATGELVSLVSPRYSQTTRLLWSREARPREANSTAPTLFVNDLGGTGRASFLPALETDTRDQLLHTQTWLRGHHTLRAGADLDFTHIEQPFFLLFSGGLYVFDTVDDYLATLATGEQRWAVYLQGFGRASVDFWQREYAAFVEDDWTVSDRLRLTAGLRWDAQLNPQPDDPNPELPGSDRIASDRGMLAPRLGLTWDPRGDGSTVVRLNTGLFYSRTPALLMVSPITTNGKGQQQLLFFPWLVSAPTYPHVLPAAPDVTIAPPSDVWVFADDFRNPRTLRASLEAEHELRPGLTAGAAYVHGRMENLERLLDVNMFPAFGTTEDGRLIYPSERPDPRFARILRVESTARGRYDALTLSLRWRRPDSGAQVFYTWSRSRDTDSNERDHLNTYYQDWQHLDREYAASQNDVRHNLVGHGWWRLPWGLELGAIATAHSGAPYSHVSANDLNHDGVYGNDREFLDGRDTGRNAFRQPGYRRLDLRLAKELRLGGDRALDLALDVFNATNADNLWVSDANRYFDAGPDGRNPDLDRPDAQLGEARSLQLSLRLRF